MRLTSLAFNNNEEIPVEYTCDGEGISPPLSIAEAPSGLNSAGSTGYAPPCPPMGKHHYIFNLYALDITLDLSANTDRLGADEY